jgi:hypothetical protein
MSVRRLVSSFAGAWCGVVAALVLSSQAAMALSAPPQIGEESVTNVSYSEATLHASVTAPAVATYHFEYGPNTSYGTSVPVPDRSVGSGSEPVSVSQPLVGLLAGVTYHYRIVAGTAEGAVAHGPDMAFTTYATSVEGADSCPNAELRSVQSARYLPECRAYELVSPPGAEKEGANISTYPSRTQSSLDGDGIVFQSTTPYGPLAGAETAGAEYLARRGDQGWSSYPINPEQGSMPFSLFTSALYQAISPDLSKGVYFALTPVVPGHSNVEQVANLYLRQDLLTSQVGSYELLSDSVAPVATETEIFKLKDGVVFGGASADWSHIAFETTHDLTSETLGLPSELPKAYEWNNGIVRLAGILPDGTPAEGSVIGRGVGAAGESVEKEEIYGLWSNNAISRDGSRVIFTGWPISKAAGISNGPAIGKLYMRIDGQKTIQLNASERSQPYSPQPAEFFAASTDGSKVFFATSEALTDDAKIGATYTYMYDINAPQGHHLTLIGERGSLSDQNSGVVGVSDDGSYVYFITESSLLPGLPKIEAPAERLYLWHDGTVRYVASASDVTANSYAGLDWGERNVYFSGHAFRVSPDGKTIMFDASNRDDAKRLGFDTLAGPGNTCTGKQSGAGFEHCFEVYAYNADSNQLMCASCNPTGAAPTSDAKIEEFANGFGVDQRMQYLSNAMSNDGRYVFFDTPEALVAGDVNGRIDAYEYDTSTRQVHLISSGTCGCDSRFADASPDGKNVFITTRQRLVHVDVDGSVDLYDARVNGGIAGQNVPPPVPCTGEECQGPVPSPPIVSLPASSTFAGVANPRPAAAKALHKRKRGRKSVKHKKKRTGKGRKASHRSTHRPRG